MLSEHLPSASHWLVVDDGGFCHHLALRVLGWKQISHRIIYKQEQARGARTA